MTPFLKKYWPLLIAGAFLLWVAFRGCNNLPSHKDEKKSLDSLNNAYQVLVGQQQRKISELTFQNDSLEKRLDSTARRLNAVRWDLSARAVAVRQTLASGADAARRRDTTAIVINWDSLRAQVITGLPIVVAQDSLSQAMINDCLAQGAIKDSVATAYRYLWMTADSAYGKQRSAYNSLFADYKKANSRLKFNKTLSRGLAIALLAAGAKIFIFK